MLRILLPEVVVLLLLTATAGNRISTARPLVHSTRALMENLVQARMVAVAVAGLLSRADRVMVSGEMESIFRVPRTLA